MSFEKWESFLNETLKQLGKERITEDRRRSNPTGKRQDKKGQTWQKKKAFQMK